MTNMFMKETFIPNFVRFCWILSVFYHLWRGSYVSFSYFQLACFIHGCKAFFFLKMTILPINWLFTSILSSIIDFFSTPIHNLSGMFSYVRSWKAKKKKKTSDSFEYVSEVDLDSANWYICASLYFHKNIMCEERQREILSFFWLRLW